MSGLFLSIDGIDGCGKSTQMELLHHWLSERGHEVVRVREPGGTQLGETLRDILLHKQEISLVARAEMLLYMASRAQLVEEVIQPAILAGKTVLSDRFLLANVVYQGYGGGLPPQSIWEVGQFATQGLRPDRTILLDIEPSLAAERVGQQKDRLESRGLEYMTRVRDGYLKEASNLDASVCIMNASLPIEDLFAQIRSEVESILK